MPGLDIVAGVCVRVCILCCSIANDAPALDRTNDASCRREEGAGLPPRRR